MKVRHHGRTQQRGRSSARKPRKLPLTAHPAFAPVLGLWGAVLGAMLIMVLPAAAVQTALMGTLLGTLSGLAQPVAAVFAALILGVPLFGAAAAAQRRARRAVARPSLAERAVRQVMPIDPARDLGSRRLDEPVDAMPFATSAWRDADPDKAQTPPADARSGAPAPGSATVPRELDLAAFAELPGRNAVWVEDAPQMSEAAPTVAPVSVPLRAPAPVAEAPAPTPAPPPVPGTAALARLRAVPAETLSLAQMVERFAGALHEHRAAPAARALSAADLAAREAALAEALRALAALSGGAGAGHDEAHAETREEPLRAALAQLHPRREAGRGAG
jgi:hypothetical protein